MSFGGPQWPQQPQQPGQQPYGQSGQQPYGQQQQYGQGYGQQPENQYGGQADPFPGASSDGTPDWGALADASAAGRRRKRWLVIGGGALAALAVAAIVATAVVKSNDTTTGKNGTVTPTGSAAPTDAPTPGPSFSSVAPPPPPNPKDFISDEKKDKAPLSAEGLFPGKKLTMNGRAYQKGATSSTTDCASVGEGGLGAVLKKNGCDRVIRATYVQDGAVLTVGVAVFPNEAAALKAKDQATGGIAPLAGAGVKEFCRATVCLRRANSIGRYAYFTQAGFTNGSKVTTSSKAVFQASDDLGTFAFNQIYARGKSQAAAAAAGAPGQ
ncbi:hypothetical protein ACF09C_32450 [Streptomyces sp. NPDC014870]|uniref:hypothetical protein n=1 Tax=Streptomyces sp. NPDC014870 TaxID=3364925 RepID=UPI0037015EFD